MQNYWKKGSVVLLSLLCSAQAAIAQIIPASNNTSISESQQEATITGGESIDGNLFHEFYQFDIHSEDIVNFLTLPDIQNVISQIRGDASYINGSLGVVGSSANLYLLNPSGILFGPNVQLNLPGSFTAATATDIGFDDLTLDPATFTFTTESSIVNAGELAVGPGQSISLFGNTLINTGSLIAPGGNITLTAVEAGHLIRLNPSNGLLSIEVSPTQAESPHAATSLGELLTGRVATVDALKVDADGTVRLTHSNTHSNTVIGNSETSCSGCLVASGTLNTDGAAISEEIGGEINLFGSQVNLLNGTLSATGAAGGGTLRIGGDYQGSAIAPTANQTYIDLHSVLTTDATESGSGGQTYVWSDESTQFYGHLSSRGAGGSVDSGGSGGFAEISGKQNLTYNGSVDLSAEQGSFGTLLFDPLDINILNGTGPAPSEFPTILNNAANSNTTFTVYEENLESITAGTINLQASRDIFIADLTDNKLSLNPGVDVIFQADVDGDGVGDFLMFDNIGPVVDAITGGGNITISATNIEAGDIIGNEDITLSAQDNITTRDIRNNSSVRITSAAGSIDMTDGTISTNAGDELILRASQDVRVGAIRENSVIGDLRISSAVGDIDIVGSSITDNTANNLFIEASGDITVGDISDNATNAAFTITSSTGAIDTTNGSIIRNEGNELQLRARQDITTGDIGANNINGNLTIISTAGNVDTTQGIIAQNTVLNDLRLQASNNITTGSIADNTAGDDIKLVSVEGTINTTQGAIVRNVAPDELLLQTNGDIRTGLIQQNAVENLNVSGGTGSIDTTSGAIVDNSIGTLYLQADQNITTGLIQQNAARNLNVSSGTGSIDTTGGAIVDNSIGTLHLRADQNITTGTIGTNIILDELFIESVAGSIDTTQGSIADNNTFNIRIEAAGDITLGTIEDNRISDELEVASAAGRIDTRQGAISRNETGGDLEIRAGGEVQTGLIQDNIVRENLRVDSATASLDTTNGAIIDNTITKFLLLRGERDVTLGDVVGNEGGFMLAASTSDSIDATGARLENNIGTFSLQASGDVAAGALRNTDGNLILVSNNGDIVAESLTTTNGDIFIDTFGNLRVTGSVSTSAPLTSIQSSPGKTITIRQGTDTNPSFFVGDATLNGTAHAISSQDTTLDNVELPGSYKENTIERITADPFAPAISINQPPAPPTAPAAQPTTPTIEPTSEPANPPATSTLDPLTDKATDISLINLSSPSARSSAPTIALDPSINAAIAQTFSRTETRLSDQFRDRLQLSEDNEFINKVATLTQAQNTLQEAERTLDISAALLYVYFSTSDGIPRPSDSLELLLITPSGEPILHQHADITRAQVEEIAAELRHEATYQTASRYLAPAQQLYSWFIAPLETTLKQEQIDNISFILDDGLRTLPIAVLHDGQQFIVENYSLSLLPTFSLTDFRISDRTAQKQNLSVLAMGASEFENQPPLPAAEAEVTFIADNNWADSAFLNEAFTINNFKSQLNQQLNQQPYDIVHLATHATFESGSISNSYIQFWGDRLNLSQLDNPALNLSDIGLIILSACNTALGDPSSEYGFAGFSVKAGSRAALASLWPVSDEGTLGFMTQFYQQFANDNTQSEALRQAQLAMIRGDVGIDYGTLYGPNGETQATLPELAESGTWNFSHPFYWAAFTMIGSPW